MSVPSLDYFPGGTQENKQLTLFSDSIGKKIKIKNNHSHEKTLTIYCQVKKLSYKKV